MKPSVEEGEAVWKDDERTELSVEEGEAGCNGEERMELSVEEGEAGCNGLIMRSRDLTKRVMVGGSG
jgi:hypothetical protein